MGERLAGGNVAIALLGNTLATGAGLVVLISVFGPLSGAHFNPAVTVVFAIRREMGWSLAGAYILAQLVGGVFGAWIAHAMFSEPILQVSTKLREGPAQAFAEFVATFGLIAAILGSLRFRPDATPTIVGLYITSAYWFTASTSFANPAVDHCTVAVEHVRRHSAQLSAGLYLRSVQRGRSGESSIWMAAEYANRPMNDAFSVTIFHNPDCEDLAQRVGDDPSGRLFADYYRVPEGRLVTNPARRASGCDGVQAA